MPWHWSPGGHGLLGHGHGTEMGPCPACSAPPAAGAQGQLPYRKGRLGTTLLSLGAKELGEPCWSLFSGLSRQAPWLSVQLPWGPLPDSGPCPLPAARDALSSRHVMVKTRPLAQGTRAAKAKARACAGECGGGRPPHPSRWAPGVESSRGNAAARVWGRAAPGSRLDWPTGRAVLEPGESCASPVLCSECPAGSGCMGLAMDASFWFGSAMIPWEQVAACSRPGAKWPGMGRTAASMAQSREAPTGRGPDREQG